MDHDIDKDETQVQMFVQKTKLIPVEKKINFHVITLFPESFTSYINESIIARAQEEKRISIYFYNPRFFVTPTKIQESKDLPYLRIDDKPYGGGPGMVMEAFPIIKAIEKARLDITALHTQTHTEARVKILFMSPGGIQFTNNLAKEWVNGDKPEVLNDTNRFEFNITNQEKITNQKIFDSKELFNKKTPAHKDQNDKDVSGVGYTDIILVCGRYEGIDERVNVIFKTESITVGPYVLTGGELPAMIVMDAMARQIKGVLGNFDSREEERVSSHAVYTRPEVLIYEGLEYKVPEVLLSGDHKKIEEWRLGLDSISK